MVYFSSKTKTTQILSSFGSKTRTKPKLLKLLGQELELTKSFLKQSYIKDIVHYNHLTLFFEDGDAWKCYHKTLLFSINSADIGI